MLNLVSVCRFTFDIFRKGIKRNLSESDVYEAVKGCRSEKLGVRLEKEWEKERAKSSPNLGKCFARIYGWTILLLFIIDVVVESFVK